MKKKLHERSVFILRAITSETIFKLMTAFLRAYQVEYYFINDLRLNNWILYFKILINN